MTKARKLTKRKSSWKALVKKAISAARLRYSLVRSGAEEDMGEFYALAAKMARLGRLGDRLLSEANALDMQTRTVLDIEWNLFALSQVSKMYHDLALHLSWPLRSLQVYEAPAIALEHFEE